jgi:hypothetical protein
VADVCVNILVTQPTTFRFSFRNAKGKAPPTRSVSFREEALPTLPTAHYSIETAGFSVIIFLVFVGVIPNQFEQLHHLRTNYINLAEGYSPAACQDNIFEFLHSDKDIVTVDCCFENPS